MLTVGQAKGKGVVFVEGDMIGSPVVNIGDLSFDVNYSSVADNWPVNSFTDRKHTDNDMPCGGDFPVVVELINGDKSCRLADYLEWVNDDTSFPIVTWKPDLEALEKLANEKEEKPMAEKQYTYELVRNLTTNEIEMVMIDGEVFYSFNGKDKYHWENGMFVNKDGDYVSTRRSLYRKKEIEMVTRTITYPKPVNEPLSVGDEYWVIDGVQVYRTSWNNDSIDSDWLSKGRIHLTKENAQTHWDALFGGK